MLERIKKLNDGKDMTINTVSKINYQNVGYNKENSATTTTQAENTIVAIQRIEEALTRVQEHKRRCIESLHKMDIDDNRLELELMKMEIEAAKESGEYENQDNGEALIEALNLKAKEVWADENTE